MIFLICLKFHFSFLKNILLYPEYEKRIFSSLFCPKNTNNKTFDLLTKTMDLLLWDISIFLTFSKPHLSGIKNILFYPEYQKTVFFDLIRQKMRFRKRSIFLKKPWTIPFGKFRFHPEHQKTNFFCPKNTHEKIFDFLGKTMD